MATPQEPIKQITFKVKEECPNPIMLIWVNTLGGASQWLFERQQEVNSSVNPGEEYDVFYDDIQQTTVPSRQIQSTYNDIWTLFADNLTKNEVRALQEITISPQVYAINKAKIQIGVIAFSPSVNYSRFPEQNNFTIQIKFPKNFNPERWLLQA